jgi:hypothetical protein
MYEIMLKKKTPLIEPLIDGKEESQVTPTPFIICVGKEDDDMDYDDGEEKYFPLFSLPVEKIWSVKKSFQPSSDGEMINNFDQFVIIRTTCFHNIIVKVKNNKYIFFGPNMFFFELPPEETIVNFKMDNIFLSSYLVTTHFLYLLCQGYAPSPPSEVGRRKKRSKSRLPAPNNILYAPVKFFAKNDPYQMYYSLFKFSQKKHILQHMKLLNITYLDLD